MMIPNRTSVTNKNVNNASGARIESVELVRVFRVGIMCMRWNNILTVQ